MTLLELSKTYEASAEPLRRRLSELRQLEKKTGSAEERFQIQRRIRELTPMLTEMNELAELTAHYYDRGYWRSENYTV